MVVADTLQLVQAGAVNLMTDGSFNATGQGQPLSSSPANAAT